MTQAMSLQVGLKGVFLKEAPSYDELLLQLRWMTAHVASTFLRSGAEAKSSLIWDLTGFPEWCQSMKAGRARDSSRYGLYDAPLTSAWCLSVTGPTCTSRSAWVR